MFSILSVYTRNINRASKILKKTNWKMSSTSLQKKSLDTNCNVILETCGSKGIITLNRPKALNSLSSSMIRKMYPQIKAWDSDPSVKLIIIKSSIDRVFCAGGDVREVIEAQRNGQLSISQDIAREQYQLNYLIGTLHTPYVALIDGITMGGGLGISVHGSYRVCTERTVCATPEATIGFSPDVGSSYFLPKLPGKIGLFMALTSGQLQGRDVFRAGIATHFVHTKKLKNLKTDLMNLENPTFSDVERVLSKHHKQSEVEYKEESVLISVVDKMNTAFAADSVEKIIESLQKEGSEWSEKQYNIMMKLPPTSLKVIFELLRRGAHMTLQECLKMEYRLGNRFLDNPDFYEGVRAVLIDKDNKPTWNPATLEEVTEEKVESYFKPLPAHEELKLY